MRRIRSGPPVRAALVAVLAAWTVALHAQGGDAFFRGQDFETRDQYPQAAAAYREALARDPVSVAALLGLERVYAQLGQLDSLLPVLDTAIARAPRVAAFRAAELRTFHGLGSRDRVRAAYERWRHDVPGDPTPYRDYSRMLIQDGFTAAADSVLREGLTATGSMKNFSYELAQLRAATGLWVPAATAWREALAGNAYLVQAAVFSLAPAPDSLRTAIQQALAAAPASSGALHAAASLELAWGSPAAAWDALRALSGDSAAVLVWLDFARRAEEAEAWLAARDALVAAAARQPSAQLSARAATDAIAGGDAAGAVALAVAAERGLDSAEAARTIVAAHLRALGQMGKPREAEALLHAYGAYVTAGQRSELTRLLAWAWVRTGNLERARALLAESGGDDAAAEGWIALYSGDLATARARLRSGADEAPDRLEALALLGRTRADRSASAGSAFLALARGDTLVAARTFVQAADSLGDARSLLLALAARLYAARDSTPRAIALWRSIVEGSPGAPEAPEAELSWARTLRHAGQNAPAATLLEHLILTYPESALVPQARRELELAHGSLPPTT